jgi:hypothetical protein
MTECTFIACPSPCDTALQEVGMTTDTTIDVEEVVLAVQVTDIEVEVVLLLPGGIVMTSADVAGTTIAILPVIVDAIVTRVVIGNAFVLLEIWKVGEGIKSFFAFGRPFGMNVGDSQKLLILRRVDTL